VEETDDVVNWDAPSSGRPHGGYGLACEWPQHGGPLEERPSGAQPSSLVTVTVVPAGASVDVVSDDTLERRWGGNISTRGHSRERSVSSPGVRWIVMAVVVTLPWTRQRWAVPFVHVLATTPEVKGSGTRRW